MSRSVRTPSARRAGFRRGLLFAHAAVTALAGVVLAVWPAAIPATIGIDLAADAYLLSYLLAAAEFGFAALSLFAASLTDVHAIRATMLACVVFHSASAILEAIFWRSHSSPTLLANILARAIIVGAFLALLPRRDERRG